MSLRSYKAFTLFIFEIPPDAIIGISIDFANFLVCEIFTPFKVPSLEISV